MSELADRVSRIESILAGGKSLPQTPPINTLDSNDLIAIRSSSLEKIAYITYANFLSLVASGDITFVENGDLTEIQQQGLTQVSISKVGKTGQYSDLLGTPNFATEQYVDQAEEDSNTYTDDQISLLEYNEFKGDFDIASNVPDLQDATGILNEEYRVVNAASQGTIKDFGSGGILLKSDDIIIFDGTNWEIKVNNNQSQEVLLTIPQNTTSPVSSSTLNERMRKIFNLSGYRISSQIEGVTSVGSITTPVFCILANGVDRYLLVDFSVLSTQDQNLSNILSNEGNFFILNSASNNNLLNNDFIGEIKNQCVFSTDVIDSISGITVPSNFTIFEIKESFATFFSGSETQLISIDFIGSETYIEKTYTFTDQDFLAASPITLEPALGVDTIYELSELSVSQNLTTSYSNNSFLIIKQGVDYATIVLQLTQTGKYYFKSGGLGFSGGDGTIGNDIQNKPLQLSVGSDAINGVGEIKIYLRYRVRNLW